MDTPLRRARTHRGLTQSELATATGLSRQLIGAVETARHTPSVSAALALARVLGTSVEHLFAPAPVLQSPILGRTPPPGTPVVATVVGDLLCFAPLEHRGAGARSWRAADGAYGRGRVDLFPDTDTAGFAVAGCDPALGLAAALLPERGPRRLVAVDASSGRALEALDQGRLHAAIVHGPPGELPGGRVPVERWILARWEVGLAAPTNRALDLEAVGRGALTLARRDPGAQAQRALERALAARGAPPRLRGPVAAGHLDAARRVVFGTAEVALTMRAAALAYGLEFRALEEHAVELWIARRWATHPGAAALTQLLDSRSFRARLAAVGGYDTTSSGTRSA